MKYLVRIKLSKQQRRGKAPVVAHLWDGNDTLCELWSTGGIRAKRNYKVVDSPGELRICRMCADCATPHMDRMWRAAVEGDPDPGPLTPEILLKYRQETTQEEYLRYLEEAQRLDATGRYRKTLTEDEKRQVFR